MSLPEEIHRIGGKAYLFAVEASETPEDYIKYEALRNAIWDLPDDHLACPRNMTAENFRHDGGSLFIGVFRADERDGFTRDDGHLVGFAYGFVGVRDKEIGYRDPANCVFYSQYAAVRPEAQNLGLGILIKRFQARVVRDVLGVQAITCTYDPLVGVNAYRNIHKLGMDVLKYKDACYMGFTGKLNRLDVPSDRFWTSWDLIRPAQRGEIDPRDLLAADRLAVSSRMGRFMGRSGPIDLPVAEARPAPETAGPVLVEIPFDFYALLAETDVKDPEVRSLPVDWRAVTRRAFHALFDAGWRVIDFNFCKDGARTRDFYILDR